MAALAALSAAVASKAQSNPASNAVQSDYIEHCGGCHGMRGISFPARVPRLRDKVGYFLCTSQSRAYLLRLPNVALSSLDDQRLAATMNFIVFQLGGASTKPDARQFTAEEIARERKHSLASASLIRARTVAVREIVQHCSVPEAALQF